MPNTEYLVVDRLSIAEIARIFSYIRVNPDTACWEWQGAKQEGYGVVYFRGEYERVHRLLYAWAVEPLPKGGCKAGPVLDHLKCDNPPCCNPTHVKLGPQRDNVLRGSGPSAINARKTHCKRGHPLPPKEPGERQRKCEICLSEVGRARRFGPDRERITEKERECAKNRWEGPRHDELLEKQRERQRSEEGRAYFREYYQKKKAKNVRGE